MKEFHKNARLITADELQKIKENLEKLGDISCIVHDLNSDEIVGGNQRSKIADINNAQITITEQFKKPDKQGTVAWGYVNWNGTRLLYRQVKWTKAWCEQANITANSLTGKWNEDLLRSAEWKRVPGIENWNLFIGHIAGMDSFALGLLAAAKLHTDGLLADFVARRYAGWREGIGREIVEGKADFRTLESYIYDREPAPHISGRQEYLEMLITQAIAGCLA